MNLPINKTIGHRYQVYFVNEDGMFLIEDTYKKLRVWCLLKRLESIKDKIVLI